MQMTATILDLGIAILILVSLIFGFIRGFVREFISLATWVAAFAFAVLYLKPLANELPFTLQSEIARMGMAFAIIFFGVLVIGAIINYLLSAAISSIGLGGVDRFFGALFGALRGGLIVVLMVILLGVTSFPAQSWWIDSRFIPYFEEGADWLKSRIPPDFSGYLDKAI
ncbi:MAG: CvpA family protein [Thiolinea sp.]